LIQLRPFCGNELLEEFAITSVFYIKMETPLFNSEQLQHGIVVKFDYKPVLLVSLIQNIITTC